MRAKSNIKDVMKFLAELEQHNERPWFQANRDRYDAVRKPWEEDIARLIDAVAAFDDNVRGQDVKSAVYRIYRDVRFSHDKSPYKNYFSAVLGRGGRKTVMSSYYVHFQPGHTMIGGGIWWPQKPILDQLRSLIDAEADEWVKIVESPSITQFYQWDCNTLKKMPKPYQAGNPMARYLKMKEYILLAQPGPDYWDCDDWVERVAADLQRLKPMHDFLNYVFDD